MGYTLYQKTNTTSEAAHSKLCLWICSFKYHVSSLKREKHTSRKEEITVSLPVYHQIVSAETANKHDTGASFQDVDTCPLRTGLRIPANFIQVT